MQGQAGQILLLPLHVPQVDIVSGALPNIQQVSVAYRIGGGGGITVHRVNLEYM